MDWRQLSLRWVDAYVDAGLQRGLQVATLNVALDALQMFCRFLREEGYAVPQPFTQLKALTMPRHLPRPLSDAQVHRLEQQFQSQLSAGSNAAQRQQAIMDLACFYLLWHCGLRIGEVQRLDVNDLDLTGRKLLVRNSKERKDRVIYLSDTTVAALRQHDCNHSLIGLKRGGRAIHRGPPGRERKGRQPDKLRLWRVHLEY